MGTGPRVPCSQSQGAKRDASEASADGRGKRGRMGDAAEHRVAVEIAFSRPSQQRGQASLIQGNGSGAGPRKAAAAVGSTAGYLFFAGLLVVVHPLHAHARRHHLGHAARLRQRSHGRTEPTQKYSQDGKQNRDPMQKAGQHIEIVFPAPFRLKVLAALDVGLGWLGNTWEPNFQVSQAKHLTFLDRGTPWLVSSSPTAVGDGKNLS